MFKPGDIVIAKDEYLESNESADSTIGFVDVYMQHNDYLVVKSLQHIATRLLNRSYALTPVSNTRGKFYRKATAEDIQKVIIK